MRRKDLVGKKFGMLTALCFDHYGPKSTAFYEFQCDCGNKKVICGSLVSNGYQKSCGCLWYKPKVNYIGKKFGILTTVRLVERKYKSEAFYEFLCDCGKTKVIQGQRVFHGKVKHCGCRRHRRLTLPMGESSLTKWFYRYKGSAKQRNIEFSLTKEKFKELSQKNCYYCGSPPTNIHHNGPSYASVNGIDRLNNEEGYTEINSVPCCWFCNRAKNNSSVEEFMAWIKRLIQFQTSIVSQCGQKEISCLSM